MAGPGSGQGRQMRFAISAMLRRLAFKYHGSFLYRWRYSGPVPERLLIAPIDLRTADPTVALDVYAGRFVFCGRGYRCRRHVGLRRRGAERGMGAPAARLRLAAPSARDRHGAVALECPQQLVDEWIRLANRHDAVAWEPDVVARRIISWLAQTPLVLEGCDLTFYRRFMRSITRQIRYLRRTAYDGSFPACLDCAS